LVLPFVHDLAWPHIGNYQFGDPGFATSHVYGTWKPIIGIGCEVFTRFWTNIWKNLNALLYPQVESQINKIA